MVSHEPRRGRHTGQTERHPLVVDRLRNTVDYASRHSPFYREVLDEGDVASSAVGTPADMAQLPIIDATAVLENQPPATQTHRFRNPDATVRRPFHTSGTTGRSKEIFKSYDEMERIFEDVRRGFERFGVTTDDVVANYCPFVGLNISCFGKDRIRSGVHEKCDVQLLNRQLRSLRLC